KSKEHLAIVAIGPGPKRLEPPPELAEDAALVFRETVAAVPANHFQVEDSALLAAYSRTVVLARQAAAELPKNPLADGKVSPWLATHTAHVRLLAQLSIRLKLGPRARRPDARRAAKPTPRASYYETHPGPAPEPPEDRSW